MVDANTDTHTDAESTHHGLNPLQLLARRWTFLLAGLVIGAVLGVLLFTTTPPQYQSTAQVLVVKKGSEITKEGEGRIVEDYVATQVTLIKSEKIRLAAAAKARALGGAELPGDDRTVAEMIGLGLTVVREKDASSSTGGSGVLNLTLRGGTPELCRTLLEAVILAHQAELDAIYHKASRDRLTTLGNLLDAVKQQRQVAGDERIQRLADLRKITPEEVTGLRTRVTAQREQVRTIKTDLSDLDAKLGLIAKTAATPEARANTLAQLTAQYRAPGAPAPPGQESTGAAGLRSLEFQRRELTQTLGLGKDHPRMIALDSRIRAIKEEIDRPTEPGAPTLDELGAHTMWLDQKKSTAMRQLGEIEQQLKDDEGTLKKVGGLQDQAEALAAQIQHADAEIMRLEAEKLARLATAGAGGYAAEQITPPAAGRQIAPVLIRSLMMGLALGALLGVGLMVLAEARDKSFRSPVEIRRRLGLPVVGHIPMIRPAAVAAGNEPALFDPLLVAALRPKSSEAEAYRGLRTQLYFSTQGRGHQVIQVTSPTPGDGKSTLASNLALSIAHSGKRTILVDCDFRKPRVHKLFTATQKTETGLAEVIAGLRPLTDAIVPSGADGLDLVPCGPRPANPAELLGSPQFQQVLVQLREQYDFVIVDTPPLLAVADPAIVAPQVDGVLMIFRMTKKARPTAERAREVLAGVGANTLGVIVNAARDVANGYGYGYGYSYQYKYASYNYSDNYHNDAEDEGKAKAAVPAA